MYFKNKKTFCFASKKIFLFASFFLNLFILFKNQKSVTIYICLNYKNSTFIININVFIIIIIIISSRSPATNSTSVRRPQNFSIKISLRLRRSVATRPQSAPHSHHFIVLLLHRAISIHLRAVPIHRSRQRGDSPSGVEGGREILHQPSKYSSVGEPEYY